MQRESLVSIAHALEQILEVLRTEITGLDGRLRPSDKSLSKTADIRDLGLSARSYNALKHNDINTVEDLCLLYESDALRLKNLGMRSVREIKEVLHGMGLKLKGEK